jgi:hypothetical protein
MLAWKIRVKFLSHDSNSNFFFIIKYTASGSGDLATRGYIVKNISLDGEVVDAENISQNVPPFYSRENGSSWDGEDVEALSVKDLIFVRSDIGHDDVVDTNGLRY